MQVYLRALELDDFTQMHKWRNDPHLLKHLSGNMFFVSSEREKKSIETKIYNDSNDLYLGIVHRKSEKLIGFTSINNIDLRNLRAEWGGTLIGEKEYIGKGYGKEASTLMLDFLFRQYPIHKCYAFCLEVHPATEKLFKSLGFQHDGILRDHTFKNGIFNNLLVYSILRDEYEKSNNT